MKTRALVPLVLLIAGAAIALMLLVGPLSDEPDATLDLVSPSSGGETSPAGAVETSTPPVGESAIETDEGEFTEREIEPGEEVAESVLTGTVLAADTDEPLEGVRFEVFFKGAVTLRRVARTDEEGRFLIRGLDPERLYRWSAVKEGYAEARGGLIEFDPVAPKLELDPVRLHRGGTVAGVVSAEGGSPLAGAEVLIHPLVRNRAGLSDPDLSTVYRAETDGSGAYANRSLAAGRYRVLAQAEGYARKMRMGVEVRVGESTRMDFRLGREAELSGTVRDKQGMPVKGARIRGSFRGKGGPYELPRAHTGEDGRYRVPHIPPGNCNVLASAKGYGTQLRLGVSAPSSTVDFTLGRTSGAIEGRVTGPGGPIDAFQVKVFEERPGNYQMAAIAMMEAKTRNFEDAEGRYRIESLAAGKYGLEVYAEGCLGASRGSVEVKEGAVTSGVDFELAEAHPLRGSVTRKSDNAPVEGAEITVNLVIKGPFGEIPFAPSDVKTVTNAAGDFELTRLKEGNLSISVTHPEYGKTSKSGIKIKAGEPPEPLKLEIRRGGRVNGTVRNPEGAGQPGDYVVIQDPRDPSNRTTLETGPEGGYESELLAPGMYQVLHVDGRDTNKIKVKFARVKSGETATVDFGEPAGCRLHGKILDGGKPVTSCNVSVIRVGESMERKGEFGVSITNEKGEYDVRGVRPGEYYLFAQTGQIEGTGRARTMRVRVDVGEDDREVRTDIEFPSGAFAGSVRDAATGKPLGGATVVVMRADAPDDVRSFEEILTYYGGQALADDDGNFEVGGLEPGRYKVIAVMEGYASEDLDARELGAGRRVQLQITLGPESRITGRAVRVDGSPVENAVLFLLDKAGGSMDTTFGNTFTDVDGRFTVKGVKAGEYTLLLEAEGFASTRSGAFSLHEAGTVEKNFTLRPEARIVVAVTEGGLPVAGATVRVIAASGREIFVRLNQKNLYTKLPSRKTGADGVHTVHRLAGGSYRIEVTTGEGKTAAVDAAVEPEGEKRVEVRVGE